MTMRYRTTGGDDASLRERMKAIAVERRRFGYRRLHVLLRRDGFEVSNKRLFRHNPRGTPDGPPAGWPQAGDRETGADDDPAATDRARAARMGRSAPAFGCVADQMTDGGRFRILSIVDDCTGVPGTGGGHVAVKCEG